MVGVQRDLQLFRLAPVAAAILLEVPRWRQDLREEMRAFRMIGQEIQKGEVRIIVQQHLPDIENKGPRHSIPVHARSAKVSLLLGRAHLLGWHGA